MALEDVLGFIGAGCLIGGVAWIYPPAGLITGGVLGLTVAVMLARRSQRNGK